MLLNIPQNCAAQSVGLWLSSNRLDSPQRGRRCPLTRAAGSPFSLLSSKSAQVPGEENTGRPLGNSHHYTILHPCRVWQKKPEGKLAHKSYPGISVKSPSRTQLTWHKNPSSRNCVRAPSRDSASTVSFYLLWPVVLPGYHFPHTPAPSASDLCTCSSSVHMTWPLQMPAFYRSLL